MFLAEEVVVCSPSDLTAAVECEFGWLRRLDVKLGRAEPVQAVDAMLARTAALGDVHEQRVLLDLIAQHGAYDAARGTGVYELERPTSGLAAIKAAADETAAVLASGADVVYQGAFYRTGFLGYADFLVRVIDTSGVQRWAVWDTKLARHAKVPALLQIAAYADELERLGVPVAPVGCLVLGDRSTSEHPVADLVPVYRERRVRLEFIVAQHVADLASVAWGDPRFAACGRCDLCAAEVATHRDLLLVANMRVTQRAKLMAADVKTIDALAANTTPVDGVSVKSLATLTAQAQLQVAQCPPGAAADEQGEVTAVVFNPAALGALVQPDSGDIFFDFEGDPLWADATGPTQSGLEYLFGVVEAPTAPGAAPVFRPFWAHDRRQERQALLDFLAYVAQRRAEYPAMRIYHYAAYEKSALLRLAGRYGVGEDQVDGLLRDQILVDLYAVVRSAIRISQPSYSIKKLEPLYMGDQLRTGDVTTAGDSIVEYAEYCDLLDAGDQVAAGVKLSGIADYNEYDCISTLRLRDWLLAQAAEHGVDMVGPKTPVGEAKGKVDAEPELRASLTRDLIELPRGERTDDQHARALLAASLGYHQREDKPFWWAHYDRLQHPIDEWADTSGVLLVETSEVVEDWAKTGRQRKSHRTLRLTGTVGGGLEIPGSVFVLYDGNDLPTGIDAQPGYRGTTSATVLERDLNDPGIVQIDETSAGDVDGGAALPMALTPNDLVRSEPLHTAIVEVAAKVTDTADESPSAILDLLTRTIPRLTTGGAIPFSDGPPTADTLGAVVADLDSSYLAIQGPPGSGKTYTGARIVKTLVDRGWKVGVVGPSHRVIENFLDGVAEAGVAQHQIGKKSSRPNPRWTALDGDKDVLNFPDGQGRGYVLGGTAWDMVNTKRVQRGQFDLLVIDEAGQFSLANTIASSVSASRLLLLGDPQQLPQVSQGAHPEPCNDSALSWIMGEHHVMPSDRGYFLSRSWRMHPNVCAAVSRLSYDGELESQIPNTTNRSLAGVDAGIRVVTVEHCNNATSSIEEAQEVVRQVDSHLGLEWQDAEGIPTHPLGQGDLLVVAPYNAQVTVLRRALDAAGFTDVRVGTVDKFQGQEAPVVIVSMTASAPSEVPRGMQFLLNRNRVNVAVSRAQWKVVIVRSPQLTDYLPSNPHALAELGAFIGLCRADRQFC